MQIKISLPIKQIVDQKYNKNSRYDTYSQITSFQLLYNVLKFRKVTNSHLRFYLRTTNTKYCISSYWQVWGQLITFGTTLNIFQHIKALLNTQILANLNFYKLLNKHFILLHFTLNFNMALAKCLLTHQSKFFLQF